METIAVLDDDIEFSDMIRKILELAGYKVQCYGTAGRLLDGIMDNPPHLLILDVMLGGIDGRELVRALRHNPETRRMPIILMSGRLNKPNEVVRGFSEGADEYLTKPFPMDIFLARVSALLRRAVSGAAEPAEILTIGAVRLNATERSLVIEGNSKVNLTRLEFDLLEYLLKHPNRVFTRGLLLQEIWKQSETVTTRTVDKHIESLRKKLPEIADWIETVVNVGYVFKPKG